MCSHRLIGTTIAIPQELKPRQEELHGDLQTLHYDLGNMHILTSNIHEVIEFQR
jgi:hypothetical protein